MVSSVQYDERRGHQYVLRQALYLNLGYMFVEAAGGFITGSMALLSDAIHMLTDVGAITLALFASWLAQRPKDGRRTYGYLRAEIIGALLNGVLLMLLCGFILVEAFNRIGNPHPIAGGPVLIIATLGLLVNLGSALMIRRQSHGNLNMQGAYLHMILDAIGSIGAMVAGGVILLTGWTPVDAIVSVLIAGLILLGAWRLVREATGVLLEMAPPHVDMDGVLDDLRSIANLSEVHDLHVWTLTSGFVALSGHGVLDDPTQHQRVLDEIRGLMEQRGIGHVTFQLEPERLHQIARPDSIG